MRFIPNGSAYYSQKLNDDLYAGIGMYGNYGLGIDFGNWVGDRLIKKAPWWPKTQVLLWLIS